MRPLRSGFLAHVLFLLAACGSGGGSGGTDGGSDGDGNGNGEGDGGGGGSCERASQCDEGQVCDPDRNECASELDCSDHSDCGAGGYCDGESCAPNETGGPCDDDIDCTGGETCVGGFCGCDGDTFQAENVPPNMLISLDRSLSMVSDDVPGTNDTRWDVAVSATELVLAEHGDEIRFGLKLWPGGGLTCEGDNCDSGDVLVEPGADTADSIAESLGDNECFPAGTPLAQSLEALVGDPRLADEERSNYLLFMTDGTQQACSAGDDDAVDAVAALFAQDPPVRTFVVGFSGDVDADQLEALAVAGGTARDAQEEPGYYQADSASDLAEAFADIAGSALSCEFELSGTPPNADDLYVYFDGDEVSRDTAQQDGWDYDSDTNRITFYGGACDQLVAGDVGDLQIVFGCDLIVD